MRPDRSFSDEIVSAKVNLSGLRKSISTKLHRVNQRFKAIDVSPQHVQTSAPEFRLA